MSKRQHLVRFSILLCWMLLTCGLGVFAQHQVAHAASASLPPGYSLTVTESTSTITYGDTDLTITAQLTVPTGEHPLANPALFNFKIDSQDFGPDRTAGSDPTYTFTLKGVDLSGAYMLSAGQHTVVADYYSIPLSQTLESDPITLTVQKRPPLIGCQLTGGLVLINSQVPFGVQTNQVNSSIQVDWQDATYTIAFVGPQTFTYTNLTADSEGRGTVSTPPVPGTYHVRCTFNGTSNFSAVTSDPSITVIVSAGNQPVIKLYSNPTTIKGGQSTTLEIVVSGTSGLPTPTGQVGLYMGNMFIRPFNLGAGGRSVIQTTFPSTLPANIIQVMYFGDTVYAESYTNFSLTNPPLPAGSGQPTPVSTSTTTGTPTPGAGGTPVASSTAIANGGTPGPSNSTANGGTTIGSQPTGPASNLGNMAFWVALVALLLLAAGGIGAIIIVLRKRARAAPMPARTRFPYDDDF
jgi:hypothetical protein